MSAGRFAVGMFGSSIPINMVRASMLLYYVDLRGLDVRAYGIVMAIYAIIDALDNPVLGYFSDRTRSRWGRRRPWLRLAAPLIVASFIAFFAAPSSLEGIGLVIWFAVFAILTEAADSMFAANYSSLLPEAFPREHDRALANSLRQGLQLLAMVLSVAVTPWLATQVLGTQDETIGFTRTALIYGAIALVAFFIFVTGVREDPERQKESPLGFFRSVGDILKTPLFWAVGIASACYLIPLAITLSGMQLYVKYSLNSHVGHTTTIMGVAIAVAALLLPVWTSLVRRFGAPPVWRAGFVVLALGYVPMAFAHTLPAAIFGTSIVAIGWSGLLSSNDLIQARILDADARRHGVHREGIFMSAFGVFARLTGALSGVALTTLALIYGYYSGENPGENPGDAFRLYTAIYPLIFATVGVLISNLIKVPPPGEDVQPAL